MKSPVYAFHSCAHALSTHGHPTTRESVGSGYTNIEFPTWRLNVVRCCWSSEHEQSGDG
jgi:hypothetical protein